MPQIEVIIGHRGETTITTSGFAGAACRDATRRLEQALGQSTAEQLLPEFFQSADVQQPQQNGL